MTATRTHRGRTVTPEEVVVVIPLTPEQMYEVAANLRTLADTVQLFGLLLGAETPETIRGWATAIDHAIPAAPMWGVAPRTAFPGMPQQWEERSTK